MAIAGRNEVVGRETAERIGANGGRAVFVPRDVTSDDQARNAVETTTATFGKLDVLYNNAGGVTAKDGPLTEIAIETFWDALRLNLFGTWVLSRYAIPHMIDAGSGIVINTVSGVALKGRPGGHAYAAAKGAVVSLTRSMAVEYAPKVRVNAISPTKSLTERVARLRDSGHLARTLSHSEELLGWGEPGDVAGAAVFLASDESRMITGHILPVDSGTSMS